MRYNVVNNLFTPVPVQVSISWLCICLGVWGILGGALCDISFMCYNVMNNLFTPVHMQVSIARGVFFVCLWCGARAHTCVRVYVLVCGVYVCMCFLCTRV